MTKNEELKMILAHWPSPPYQCGSGPDIMQKALARIEELEAWQLARLETWDMDAKRIQELERALRDLQPNENAK